MVGCPWLKAFLVRAAATILFHFADVATRDPTNGFRLFSRRVIEQIKVESTQGFTYSLELLVKVQRLRWGIAEVPARWFERSAGRTVSRAALDSRATSDGCSRLRHSIRPKPPRKCRAEPEDIVITAIPWDPKRSTAASATRLLVNMSSQQDCWARSASKLNCPPSGTKSGAIGLTWPPAFSQRGFTICWSPGAGA